VQPTVIDWDDASLEEFPGNGVRKRRIPGAGAELVRVEVPAGTRAGRHSHPFEQFVQVISGSGVLETEAGTREFRQGSVFHLPGRRLARGGVPHRHGADRDQPGQPGPIVSRCWQFIFKSV
jgi:quercetin dioxygenase-like cupin family protein